MKFKFLQWKVSKFFVESRNLSLREHLFVNRCTFSKKDTYVQTTLPLYPTVGCSFRECWVQFWLIFEKHPTINTRRNMSGAVFIVFRKTPDTINTRHQFTRDRLWNSKRSLKRGHGSDIFFKIFVIAFILRKWNHRNQTAWVFFMFLDSLKLIFLKSSLPSSLLSTYFVTCHLLYIDCILLVLLFFVKVNEY